MCVPAEEARCSIRFSLGKWTSQSDIDQVLEVLPRIMTKLRNMSPLYKNLTNNK
jgi:cysteine desulfurase